MKFGISRLTLLTLAAVAAAPLAYAQTAENPFLRGRHVPVTDRPQPEYDALPLRVGVFSLNSSLGVSVEHNSNVLSVATNETDDVLVRVTPQVELSSNWSSHALVAGVNVNHREYVDADSETATDYGAYVNGRLDVTRDFRINGQINTSTTTEPRYEPSSQNLGAGDPVQYDVASAEVSATYQRSRYQLDVGVGASDTAYDRADQMFRDVMENYVRARGSLAVSPDIALFVEGRVADLDFAAPVGGALDRDSTRSDVRVGVNFELRAPFRGEISAGYVEEDKKDAAQPDTDGLSLNARLQWLPTQLTTVTFSGGRSVFDPGLANNATAFDTFAGVRVDHELRRNILLFAEATSGTIDFEDTNPEIDRFDAQVGAGYRMNRHARFDLYYQYHGRDGFGGLAGDTIEQHIVGLSLRLRP